MGKVIGRPGATKGRKLPPEPLTKDEVEALLRQCSRRAPTGVRNRALIAVMWRAGLRVAEALDLEVKDLDPEAGTVRVRHGKGDRDGVCSMDVGGFALVERWLDRRRRLGLNGRERVFTTLRGAPLSSAYVRALLPRLGRRAAIAKRVHAHGLRHTLATEMAREGKPLDIIQGQLRHRSIATTARYIQRVAPTRVIEAMRARQWAWEDV